MDSPSRAYSQGGAGSLYCLSCATASTFSESGIDSSSDTTSSSTATGTVSGSGSNTPSSNFLESLASSYSMTSAKIATLAAPPSALPSPDAAAEFISSSWPVKKTDPSEFVTFVEDPIESSSGEVVLSVEYPKGQYSGGEKGGANMRFEVFGEGKTRAMLSYQVGFEANFDFVKGGKLAGLFGGDVSEGCTGGHMSEACFSARFMWRENGEGEVYGYVPTYEGQCEDAANETSVACHGKMGQSFNRGSFSFHADQYTTLTEVAILNSNPSADTEANGYLAVFAGETLAFERADIVFRTNTSVFFSSILFQSMLPFSSSLAPLPSSTLTGPQFGDVAAFFGGSTEDYASTVLTHTYYKNWHFYEGEEASQKEGKQVVVAGV
ncbi:hypothetical protein JCM16303_004333 [Sporobolomyces ruberrimus]